MMCKIIVFEKLRFRPKKAGVFKIFTLECDFEKCIFGDRFQRIRVYGRTNRREKIRFQTKTDACGRGLNETKYCVIDEKNSCAP